MTDETELELVRAVARIEESIVSIRDSVKVVQTYEPRIRSLEKWRAWAAGITIGGSAVIGMLWKVFGG